MSDPAKKDDHGGGHGEKKSIYSRMWGAVAIILAVIAFLFYTKSTTPMVFDGLSGTLSAIGNGFGSVGSSFYDIGNGVSRMRSGGGYALKEVCVGLIIALIIAAIMRTMVAILMERVKGKGGDAHGEKKEEHH